MGNRTTFNEDTVEKCLSTRERNEPEAIARLRSEATLLGLLSPLSITPRLLERGEDAQRGPWHRTERIKIRTLAQRLAETEEDEIVTDSAVGIKASPSKAPPTANAQPLDAKWIERAVAAAFRALGSLHDASDAKGPLNVVHGDLSPANIAINDDASSAILLDLDLACWRDGSAPNDGAFRGTIAYAAPEVARGEKPTTVSDLFSLSATLLHAVMGTPPRVGDSFAALLARAAESPLLTTEGASALEKRGPGHAAIVRCLAHEPSDRPASARAVLAMLGAS